MADFEKAITALEYDKILKALSDCAYTEGAKVCAERLRPFGNYATILRAQKQTSDAKKIASLKGTPSFGCVKDMTTPLERAKKGATLSNRELLEIAEIWRVTRSLTDYFNTDNRSETVLDEIFLRLKENRSCELQITRSIIAEDSISDDASPALSDIRRKMRNVSNRIKDILQKYISGGEHGKYLQENIITTRVGRFVIPVKVEYKNEIKGLIHDTSSSGATVFIEPMSVVEANNELRELESREAKEIERILAELSAMCAEHSESISANYQNITELAFIFARAELSFKMNAAEPTLLEKPYIDLIKARHPLLDQKKVVPINVSLGREYDSLIITGPNTGGKTVTLKTIGLLVLMAQSGLHIPADETSVVGTFESVLANIGDEQSIEQSLSTFSANMVNIVEILNKCDEKSLVLFDELGAGTDPVEGAALAVSILERVRENGALSAATTHYAELKEYAIDTDGVCNASCEFDLNTLKPTYRLIIGTPGKSNAFAISLKLGLEKNIIDRAEKYVSGENKRFEKIIEKLEHERIQMEQSRAEAERIKRELEAYRISEEKKIEKKIQETERELNQQRTQAVRMVEGAKATSDYILKELDDLKKKKDSKRLADELENARNNIRKRLKEIDDVVNPVYEYTNDDYVLPRSLKKGDEVILAEFGKMCVLLEDPDKNGDVFVQAGVIKTRTNISKLRLPEDAKTYLENSTKKIKEKNTRSYNESIDRSFSPEIDLRGQNGEDAWFMVDRYLDSAKIAGVNSITIVHGKGTGALRKALWNFMKKDRRIKSFRLGQYGEGDGGVTIVNLK